MKKQKLDIAIVTVAFGKYKNFLMQWVSSVTKLSILPNEIILGVDEIDLKLKDSLLALLPDLKILEIPRMGDIHYGFEYNFLISKTNSEWICKIDVDDIVMPDAYEELVDAPFDILAFNLENSKTKSIHSAVDAPSAKKVLDSDENFMCSLSPFRKWIWEEVKFKDLVFDDWAFWIESAKLDPIMKKSSKINYIYNCHEFQATKKVDIPSENLKIQKIRNETKTRILESRFSPNKGLNVIFNFYPLWPVHWETSLEVAESLIRLNQKIFLFNCNSDFTFCDSNPSNEKTKCESCILRQNKGLNLLSGKFSNSNFIESPTNIKIIDEFLHYIPDSKESLLNLVFEEFDIGKAVYSSLSSQWILNRREFNFQDPIVKDLLTRALKSTLKIYLDFSRFIDNNKVSNVYIFNGRFSLTSAIVHLCSLNSINFTIHERASDLEKFLMLQNNNISSISSYNARVNLLWNNSSRNRRDLIGHDFFRVRRKGVVKNWRPYLQLDSANSIDKFPRDKKIITIFLSSESEFHSYFDWNIFSIDGQVEVIKQIINHFDESSNFYFYVRAHPNQQEELENINFESSFFSKNHVKFFMPNSNVDSYELLLDSDIVLHFGSTIGLESTYWGIPSIALRASIYAGIDDIWYFPKDYEELYKLMELKNLPAKSQLGAVKCGFYENTYGNSFLFSSERELGKVTFKGQDLTLIEDSVHLNEKNFDFVKNNLDFKQSKITFILYRKIKKFLFS